MQTNEPKRFGPIILWGSVAVLLIAALFAYRYFFRDKVEVRTAKVTYQNLISSTSSTGKVEPIEEFQAHAPSAGVIKKIYVGVGDKVKVGTLLISLADSDAAARIATATSTLRTAESNAADISRGGTTDERIAIAGDLERARSQEAQAEKDLAALQTLQSHGAASANEVASAQGRLASAQSSLRSLQQRSTGRYGASDLSRSSAALADARATLAAAQSTYAAYNIHTPISGSVYAIPVSTYDFVPAGDDLLDIADLDRVQVRAYFDEPDIGKLQHGQEVKIVWDAKPGQTWHGHIDRAPTTVIPYGTRSVGECIITVDDAHGDLLPNINVTVTVTVSRRENALSIPREALHTDGGNYVYRVAGGRLQKTPVTLGVVNLTRVEILSGLSDHDVVALNSTTNRDLTNNLEVVSAD